MSFASQALAFAVGHSSICQYAGAKAWTAATMVSAFTYELVMSSQTDDEAVGNELAHAATRSYDDMDEEEQQVLLRYETTHT